MRRLNATYRVQLNSSFDFRSLTEILGYLDSLGISDIYASPITRARQGSLHGYDVVDPNQINPELGTPQAFEALISSVRKRHMGWVQDFVPNHMAFDGENHMLMDVLENGQASAYAHFFDIDWDHPCESMRGRLLAPFLGRFYVEELEDARIQLRYDERGFSVNYYHLRLPLKIASYRTILNCRQDLRLDENQPEAKKFFSVLAMLEGLSKAPVSQRKQGQVRSVKETLWQLYGASQQIRAFIDGRLVSFNGRKGVGETFNALDSLLSEQFFRLAFWKVGAEEINYRRFFTINELISLRVEDEDVFRQTHVLLFKLLGEAKISGVRVDHIDGLYDPQAYLERLRRAAPDATVVTEKILARRERLPSDWPVEGTTGYDFLNNLNGIFCQGKHSREFNRIYVRFTGLASLYEDLVCDKKRLIIGKHLAGNVDNLAHLMKGLSSRDRSGSDITLYGLRRALVEVLAHFPVYRTYVCSGHISEADRLTIQEAVNKAMSKAPGLFYELNFIKKFLLLEYADYLAAEEKAGWVHFVMVFQQLTGALMAKAFEDTILYVYNRLISLNEVGGDPQHFGVSLREFHAHNEARSRAWPHALNATATHDTKRGEDVRARINVLSEIPSEWELCFKNWHKINRRKKKILPSMQVPDKNDEYFLYQTLLGAYPFETAQVQEFKERIKSYVIKAVREAKVYTAWIKPDAGYEEAYLSFVESLLEEGDQNLFLKDFLPFQKKIARYGIWNSLSQTLLKMASPGVPDFYQGSELWDFSLVDPDNRRSVDFKKRADALQDIQRKAQTDVGALLRELLYSREDGRLKLFLIWRLLEARRRSPAVFQEADYIPLRIQGRLKDHLVAFGRRNKDQWLLALAPRFLTSVITQDQVPLGPLVWQDTFVMLPEGSPRRWRDGLTLDVVDAQVSLEAAAALRSFPVALLLSEKD